MVEGRVHKADGPGIDMPEHVPAYHGIGRANVGAGRAAQREDPVSLPDLRHLDPVRPPIEEFDTNDLPAASMSRRRLGPTCSVRSMAAS